MMHEIWKPISGWPYEASSEGRIRNAATKRILKLTRQKQKMGYLVVSLSNGSRESQAQFYVHLLVCKAFHGECPSGQECRHINGNVTNCAENNLKWGTKKENQNDRFLHGTDICGEKNGRAVLTNNAVMEMRKEYAALRLTRKQAPKGWVKNKASFYGVQRDAIMRAVSTQAWGTL